MALQNLWSGKSPSDELTHTPIETEEEVLDEGLAVDPGIEDALEWANSKKPKNYQKLLLEGGIFYSVRD